MKLWNSIRGRSTPDVREEPAIAEQPTQPEKAAKRGFKLFGGPHAALCKQLKSVQANTVLEIGVGDGSRAVAVLETLAKAGQDARYLVIDQFEMAGGEVTLMEFHQSLRAAGIRPQVFPQDIANGLVRVSHTIGAVDLIVIGADQANWQNPDISAKLSRVAHNGTVILYFDGEGWQNHTLAKSAEIRRAA
ncbi:MAG: hypothetical protein AB8B91_06905 [Rubripirellula sp.]